MGFTTAIWSERKRRIALALAVVLSTACTATTQHAPEETHPPAASEAYSVVIASHLYSIYESRRERFPVPDLMWPDAVRAFARELERIDPRRVFLLGDTTRYSTEEEWALLEEAFLPVRDRLHIGLGNHEFRDLEVFAKHGGVRNAAVVVGSNKFIQLDCKMVFEEEDLAFVRRELEDAADYEHVFLLMHYFLPNWTNVESDALNDPGTIGALRPADAERLTNWNDEVVPLIAGKVDLVFVGDYTKNFARTTVQEVGSERITYVLNSFRYGRDLQSPAGADGPMVFLELRFEEGDYEVLPRTVPMDLRHPWYGFPLETLHLPLLKDWTLLRYDLAGAGISVELSYEWQTTELAAGGIAAVFPNTENGEHVEFRIERIGTDRDAMVDETETTERWIRRLSDARVPLRVISRRSLPVAGKRGKWALLRGELDGREVGRWSRLVLHRGRAWAFTMTTPWEDVDASQSLWNGVMGSVELREED